MFPSIYDYVFLLFTTVSFLWDIRTRRLPNLLNIAGFSVAAVMQLCVDGSHGLFVALTGAAAGLVLSFPLFLVKAVGAGDVKWFAAAGAYIGAEYTAYLLLGAVLLSGCAGGIASIGSRGFRYRLLSMLADGYQRIELSTLKRRGKVKFPFMAAVLPVVFYVEFIGKWW